MKILSILHPNYIGCLLAHSIRKWFSFARELITYACPYLKYVDNHNAVCNLKHLLYM